MYTDCRRNRHRHLRAGPPRHRRADPPRLPGGRVAQRALVPALRVRHGRRVRALVGAREAAPAEAGGARGPRGGCGEGGPCLHVRRDGAIPGDVHARVPLRPGGRRVGCRGEEGDAAG